MSNKVKYFILLDKWNACIIQLQTIRPQDLGHQSQHSKDVVMEWFMVEHYLTIGKPYG